MRYIWVNYLQNTPFTLTVIKITSAWACSKGEDRECFLNNPTDSVAMSAFSFLSYDKIRFPIFIHMHHVSFIWHMMNIFHSKFINLPKGGTRLISIVSRKVRP